MRTLIIILLMSVFSCSTPNKVEREMDLSNVCFEGFSESELSYFKLDSLQELISEVLTPNGYTTDSTLVEVISNCLKDNLDNYENYFRYYPMERNPSSDLLTFIRVDDYSYIMYLMLMDKSSCTPFYCLEVASSGGDGGDGYRSYSQMKNDTLNKVEILYAAIIDELTDTLTDSVDIDTVKSVSVLQKKKVVLIKSDTVSIKSSF
ncbi:hypothetical protein [Ekhidna sp. To15]|uniref:hypothetical protein n=1 Tax=Ekhidna sp. To15 TaxID=3395267 RepID=UPI003F5235BE